uniref:Exonuclease domain-containing protein n=1 Tax=Arcella intermedia TaxID=1963864 RepID=A0A6B2L405_9EUKA
MVVIDFEACKDETGLQEITEFPAIVLNLSNPQEHIPHFHKYVLPTKIDPTTVQLYFNKKYGRWGINAQEEALPFKVVFEEFLQYMQVHVLDKSTEFSFVTCGDWDLKTMLPAQCSLLGITPPEYFSRWINIKDAYVQFYNHKITGMMAMLSGLMIEHVGNHHSGIDDAMNIKNVVLAMLCDKYNFDYTASNSSERKRLPVSFQVLMVQNSDHAIQHPFVVSFEDTAEGLNQKVSELTGTQIASFYTVEGNVFTNDWKKLKINPVLAYSLGEEFNTITKQDIINYLPLNWVPTGLSQVAISKQPKKSQVPYIIQAYQVTHIVTLLDNKDGGKGMRQALRDQSVQWIQTPMVLDDPLNSIDLPFILDSIKSISKILQTQKAVLLIHCSDGHLRSSLFFYLLQRHQGLSQEQAIHSLIQVRGLQEQPQHIQTHFGPSLLEGIPF